MTYGSAKDGLSSNSPNQRLTISPSARYAATSIRVGSDRVPPQRHFNPVQPSGTGLMIVE